METCEDGMEEAIGEKSPCLKVTHISAETLVVWYTLV